MITTVLPINRPPTRRMFLSAALMGASGLAHAQPGQAANTLADGAQVTVAGPDGGDLDHLCRGLIPALNRFIAPDRPLRRAFAGGIDGVTGANQFTAQALPDGSNALLVPGTATLAWLRGDPQVQFDPARWIPLLAATGPILIAGRVPARQLTRGQKLRLGVSGPNGPEWATILGLELLGLQPVAVGGVIDTVTAEFAFAQHAVDALALRGPAITSVLATTGAQPICVLGTAESNGALTRDPMWPEIPQLTELLTGIPETRLALAWRAATIAAQLPFSLVLPPLTPAGPAEIWRHAVQQAIATVEVQAMATAQAMRMQANPGPIHALTSQYEAMAALREWTTERQRR